MAAESTRHMLTLPGESSFKLTLATPDAGRVWEINRVDAEYTTICLNIPWIETDIGSYFKFDEE